MEPSRPLDGIRVLELGSFIAGPFAGQLLADHGAEVIKVETPSDGDPMRQWGVCIDGRSLWWPTIARGKRSVAIDMRTARGQTLVRDLVRQCDVVLENFRPGRLEEWGLGYEELAAEHPGLVLVRVSGFGQTGPRAAEPGFGSVAEAFGGVRHTTGDPDRPPARTGISLGDSLGSLFAVIGTLLALQHRSRTGIGQVVDVAIYEAVFALMESLVADHELAGVTRGRTGSALPNVAPSNVYSTSDGRSIVIAANADSVFARLAGAIGDAEVCGDEFRTHAGRGRNAARLDELIGRWTASRTYGEVQTALRAHSVPHGPINTAPDILADDHFASRGMIEWLDAGFGRPLPTCAVVPRLSRSAARVGRPGPELGADTADVLRELLGLTASAIDTLTADRVIN
jgi:crotonobetainyl-CoA:carnitine CoA-transferase CaiB-like acyl-CoA transferase